MESSFSAWLTNTQGLITAVAALIGAIAVLVQQLKSVTPPQRQKDDPAAPTRVRRNRWPIVLCAVLITGAVAILIARSFATHAATQALPANARMAGAAFAALDKKDWNHAIMIASDCIDEFGPQAKQDQRSLESRNAPEPPVGAVPESEKSAILARGLLNDVAACLFVQGRAQERLGRRDEARSSYNELEHLNYARIYDPAGFFWSPASAAAARLAALGGKP